MDELDRILGENEDLQPASGFTERVMDAVAAHLGLDPVAVRRRNLIASDEMPYARHMDALETSVELDSGDYAGLLDKFEGRFGWQGLRDEAARRRAAGECVGTGLAMFIEKSGLGPVDGVQLQVGRRHFPGGFTILPATRPAAGTILPVSP